MFTSTDTKIQLVNIKIHYLRFEEEIRRFYVLALSPKRKSKI